jgi:hypothetical protein
MWRLRHVYLAPGRDLHWPWLVDHVPMCCHTRIQVLSLVTWCWSHWGSLTIWRYCVARKRWDHHGLTIHCHCGGCELRGMHVGQAAWMLSRVWSGRHTICVLGGPSMRHWRLII